jgi:hypothetical protein
MNIMILLKKKEQHHMQLSLRLSLFVFFDSLALSL